MNIAYAYVEGGKLNPQIVIDDGFYLVILCNIVLKFIWA